jgi:hypothetical protein
MAWEGKVTGRADGQQWAVGQARSGVRPQARGPLGDFVTGISARGSVSALHDDPVPAGLWTEAGEWTDIASVCQHGCDQDIAGAWDVSTDGGGIMIPLELLDEGFRAAPTLPPAGR